MEREEVQRLLATIEAIFPNFKVYDLTATVNAWHLILEDYESADVYVALKTFVKTSGSAFPPTPAQIAEMIYKPAKLSEINEGEAWALVRKAIGRSTYYAQEEFDKLPAEVRDAVGSASQLRTWAMSEDFNESVIASNFRSAYKQAVARKETIERLPIEAQAKLETLQRLALGGGDIG